MFLSTGTYNAPYNGIFDGCGHTITVNQSGADNVALFNYLGKCTIKNLIVDSTINTAVKYMPMASYELPYEGVKEILLVDEVDNKEFLTGLFNVMYEELPVPKPKKNK